MLSYGGGLVGGDRITLSVDVQQGATLALLTQGSTKVFKVRSLSSSLAATASDTVRPTQETQQSLHVKIAASATLLLIPDPVQPFEAACYRQDQHFHLADTSSSCIVLDWLLGGRVANGEVWAFERYRSTNQITRREQEGHDKLLLRDAQWMDKKHHVARQMGSRHCIATLLLAGSETRGASTMLLARFKAEDRIMGFKAATASLAAQRQEESLIWTVAQHRDVTVLKCVGGHGSSEDVKRFLSEIVDQAGWRTLFGRDALRALE